MLKYKYECDKCDTVATQLKAGVPTDWVSVEIVARVNGVSVSIPGKLICPECALKMGINPADVKSPETASDQLYDLIYEIGADAASDSRS